MRPKKTEIPWREDRERAPRATMAAGASRCRISGQRGQPDNDWQQTLGVTPMMVSCSCGQVECEATGAPIVTVACYCDDCQEGSRQIEELPNAPRVRDADGGTAYVLYRKDRLKCSRGRDLLRDLRIREKSPTTRVVASCCNSALYLDFEKGHWLSIYRARLGGVLPPLQMRIQTRFIPKTSHALNDVQAYPGFPFRFIAKLFIARIAMLLPG
jgi:hypothetical protein